MPDSIDPALVAQMNAITRQVEEERQKEWEAAHPANRNWAREQRRKGVAP